MEYVRLRKEIKYGFVVTYQIVSSRLKYRYIYEYSEYSELIVVDIPTGFCPTFLATENAS